MPQDQDNDTWVLGVDVGGTFTDLVALSASGQLLTTKTSTTPDQSDGVMQGIARLAIKLHQTTETFLAHCTVILHGSTVATNALLEYRGASVGLLTTQGFRDEIEFRRAYKESVFSPRLQPPHPIVPRRLRLGIPERLDAQGGVLTPLDEAATRAAVQQLKAEGVQSIAVCLLFSFVNPIHEQRIAEIIREEYPAAFVSLSHAVLPQVREFERVSTTVVNGYVGPVMQAYLGHLDEQLRSAGFGGELFIMQSHGGVQNVEQSSLFAVGTLLSGPAGCVTAGAFIGARAGYHNLITVDMGGTSYDVSVIENLQPTVTTESWISRYRVALPMMDIHTIGAGGGSIAWIDAGGLLRVGPRSAGSYPGPACYGRGGTEPTVTDADLLLGLLNPDFFLEGEMQLERNLAVRVIDEHIAQPLGISTIEAALAIVDIVNNTMSDAIHYVSTKRGYDPRNFALLAAGGAGAIHASKQAEHLGITTVVVPALSSLLSALGDVVADLKVSETRTRFQTIETLDLDTINDAFEEMETAARARIGPQQTAVHFETRRFVDLRYVGEVHEVTVPVRSRTRRITRLNLAATLTDFHNLHEQLYAHKDVAQQVEVLNLRLDLIGLRERLRMEAQAFEQEDPGHAKKGERAVYFTTVAHTTPVYDGGALQPGNLISGPAIIERPDTTIVVYPEHEALIDTYGNCVLEIHQNL